MSSNKKEIKPSKQTKVNTPETEKAIKDCVKSHQKRHILGSFLSWMGGILMPLMLILLTYGIIMISKGYRLTKEGQIIQTGVLSVTSNVRGASLYINSEYKGNIPKVISGIELDTYEIKVSKEDYYDYNFTVPINPSYSFSVYSKLYLLPEKIEYNSIAEDVGSIFTSKINNKDVILIKQSDDNNLEISKCTLSTTILSKPTCNNMFELSKDIDLTELDYSKAAFIDTKAVELKISPDNKHILMEITILEEEIQESETIIDIFKEKTETANTEIEVGKELLLLTLTGKDVKPTFLERIPQNIDQIEWSEDSSYLFFERNNDLISYDISKETINIIIGNWEEDKLEYQLINGSIVFWDKDGLELRDFDGKTYDPIITPKQKFSQLPKASVQTFTAEDTQLIAIDASGLRPILEKNDTTYVLDLNDNSFLTIPECSINEDCIFDSYSPDGEKVVFKKDNGYYLYWIEKEEWDYLTEDRLYELFVCNERKCNLQWADDSSALFIWMQSYDDNELMGEIWYCDFWGRNKNKLITGVIDSFVVTDKASRLHIGRINETGEEIKIDFETAEIK